LTCFACVVSQRRVAPVSSEHSSILRVPPVPSLCGPGMEATRLLASPTTRRATSRIKPGHRLDVYPLQEQLESSLAEIVLDLTLHSAHHLPPPAPSESCPENSEIGPAFISSEAQPLQPQTPASSRIESPSAPTRLHNPNRPPQNHFVCNLRQIRHS